MTPVSMNHGRRTVLAALGGALAVATLPALAQSPTPLEVWKDPSCGCCKDWVAHMQANGFDVKVHEIGNNAMHAKLGIDSKFGSCHTAVVGGYVLEGHVPASEAHRLLKEKPRARGLAVPGMKVGTPGMDGAEYGGHRDPYDVLLLAADGRSATVYRHYEANT